MHNYSAYLKKYMVFAGLGQYSAQGHVVLQESSTGQLKTVFLAEKERVRTLANELTKTKAELDEVEKTSDCHKEMKEKLLTVSKEYKAKVEALESVKTKLTDHVQQQSTRVETLEEEALAKEDEIRRIESDSDLAQRRTHLAEAGLKSTERSLKAFQDQFKGYAELVVKRFKKSQACSDLVSHQSSQVY